MSVVKERLSEATDNLQLCNRKKWPVWLTPAEAGQMLRLSTATIYTLVRMGQLPFVKAGRAIRIDRDGLFYRARNGLG